ncbi:hypothetical protein [Lentibacillus sp. Marseille-P4043]|nr:hypothetical protein [Lentibacillus sp. Marseille-P4043]
MSEEQADRIIELLESIDNKLTDVQSNTSWIELHTSNIESNTN